MLDAFAYKHIAYCTCVCLERRRMQIQVRLKCIKYRSTIATGVNAHIAYLEQKLNVLMHA
jgi:hypothetical protein